MNIVYEHPESRRDVLLSNGQSMPRGDADALGYTIKPYADLVMPADRIAAAHPVHTDLVTVPPFGITIQRGTAKMMGFTVSAMAAVVPRVAASLPNPNRSWRAAIIASPEASERPSAAAELLSTQSHTTMTVDAARAFLRGLPTEQTEELTTVNTTVDPKAARLAEIESGMAAHNRGKGYDNNKQSLGVASALSAVNADPVKMKRVAEIRLNALSLRMRQGESHLASEHKKLAYALSVHAQTGVPLATVFTQMSIDASKMLKGQ